MSLVFTIFSDYVLNRFTLFFSPTQVPVMQEFNLHQPPSAVQGSYQYQWALAPYNGSDYPYYVNSYQNQPEPADYRIAYETNYVHSPYYVAPPQVQSSGDDVQTPNIRSVKLRPNAINILNPTIRKRQGLEIISPQHVENIGATNGKESQSFVTSNSPVQFTYDRAHLLKLRESNLSKVIPALKNNKATYIRSAQNSGLKEKFTSNNGTESTSAISIEDPLKTASKLVKPPRQRIEIETPVVRASISSNVNEFVDEAERKNLDKRTKVTTSQVLNNDLKVCIVNTRFPGWEVTPDLLTKVETIFRDELLKSILSCSFEEVPNYHMNNRFRNFKVITCDKPMALDFLMKVISALENRWSGVKLEVRKLRDLPSTPKAFIAFPIGVSEMSLLPVIEAQNKDLPVKSWKIGHIDKKQNGLIHVCFLIDVVSARILKEKDFRINYALYELDVEVTKYKTVKEELEAEENVAARLSSALNPFLKTK